MSDAGFALQKALIAALTGDAELAAKLGGAKVYDHVPRDARHPFVTFGASLLRDWSTGTEAGGEHVVTFSIWSRAAGRREAGEIAALVRARLHEAQLTLAGHRLILLRHEQTEVRREADGETVRALVRFRAATEPSVTTLDL